MSYRLRRMLLINARTSGAHPSGLITEVDPRDGAAVIGNNSVGKTTTLELIPLFFGHLPSQIGHSGGGRESMLRYVLPTPESAIAFEYQRGASEEHDIRLAVLRRKDNEDTPEYRFFQGPFNRGLFVTSQSDESGASSDFFLDDDGSLGAAACLGITPSKKLSSAHYRHVILGLKAHNKEAVSLRQIGTNYSFGPVDRPLANLDRLVAAVVKRQVSFQDFIAVTVDMVQQEMGAGASAWGSRDKVQIKDVKNHLTRWLSARDACAGALAKAPKVELLNANLKEHASVQMLLNALKGQVADAIQVKKDAASEILKQMRAQQEVRAEKKGKEEADTQRLHTAHGDALSMLQQIVAKLSAEQAIADDFESRGAEAAEAAIIELPTVRDQAKQVEAQIDLATAAARNIELECTRLVNSVEADASAQKSQLEKAKTDTQTQLRADLNALEARHTDSDDAQRQTDKASSELLQQTVQDANAAVAKASLEVERPQVEPSFTRAVEDCQKQLNALHAQFKPNGDAERQAAQALHGAQSKRDTALARVEQTEAALRQANAQLVQAQEQATPAEGSILDLYQRAEDKSRWHSLVRILRPDAIRNPALMPTDRADELAGLANNQADAIASPNSLISPLDLAYGWELNLQSLEEPAWTSRDWSREMVATAQLRLDAATHAHQSALDQRQQAHVAVDAAQKAHDLAKANLSIHEAKINEGQIQLEQAKAKLQQERANVVQQAQPRLDSAKLALKSAQAALSTAQSQHHAAAQARRDHYIAAKAKASLQADTHMAEIDKQISVVLATKAQSIKSIEAQRLQQLQAKGVDVEHVAKLSTQLATLRDKQKSLESLQTLVTQWQQWRDSHGPARLAQLKEDKAVANVNLAKVATEKQHHEAQCHKAAQAFVAAYSQLQTKQETLDKDAAALQVLLERDLDRYNATPVTTPLSWVDKPVTMFQTEVNSATTKIKVLERSIETAFSHLRSEFTAKEGAIKDLFDAALIEADGAAGSDTQERHITSKAKALANAFSDVQSQVVPNINTSLRTTLGEIGQFRKKVADFATEVTRFNNRLQTGMVKVSAFPWLADLSLNIRTNFDDLGFMGSLNGLNDVLRNQALSGAYGAETSRELPSEETVGALRDFASLIQGDGSIEINLASHVTIQGSVTVKGVHKTFKRESDLASIDSNGLTTILIIAMLSGMLNMIRGQEPIYVPWAADEVGKFDPANFASLMHMLKENRIDVVTASPLLGIAQQRLFARRYKFSERGSIAMYASFNHEHKQTAIPAILEPTEALAVPEEMSL